MIGGSMGGMRALEWPLLYPDRVGTAIVLASTPAASAEQIAWCAPQLAAITSDPDWQGGDYYGTGRTPDSGLGIARRIAHITYRSERELAGRFGRAAQPGEDPATGGRYAVESYLDHHAGKLVRRFDAGSYVTLTRAMNTHDITRGRAPRASTPGEPGDVLAEVLAGMKARLVVAAVDSDRLYPPSQSRAIVAAHPAAGPLHLINSPYGHDGFLIELEQVGKLIAAQLRTGSSFLRK